MLRPQETSEKSLLQPAALFGSFNGVPTALDTIQTLIDTRWMLAIEYAAFRYQAYKDGIRNEDFLRQVA